MPILCAWTRVLRSVVSLCLVLAALLACPTPARADTPSSETNPQDPAEKDQWGGHIKMHGSIGWLDSSVYFDPVRQESLLDGMTELRLEDRRYLSNWLYAEAHYQLILLGGDTRRLGKKLEKLRPDVYATTLVAPLNDDSRLINMTYTLAKNDEIKLYNRLDRLSLTLLGDGALLRLGRQAVTWGNGLIFSPLDLVNPYSPTDRERDPKVGEDMAYALFDVESLGQFESYYLVRRNPDTGEVEWDQATVAGRLGLEIDGLGFDLIAAKHFSDAVAGLGLGLSVYEIELHADATWTMLDERIDSNDGYLSLVANAGYDWKWWERDFNAGLEFYYNGLGDSNYRRAWSKPAVVERIRRGELQTLGQYYLGGTIGAEVIPQLKLALTVINNLADPSGMLQPQAIWELEEGLSVTVGANVAYGRDTSEYTAYVIPEQGLSEKTPGSAYCWLRYDF